MIDRSVTFNGVNLKKYGLKYSAFSEELPEPKVITVSIPGGSDLDITEALGPVAYKNGKHHISFYMYYDSEGVLLLNLNQLIALVHGKKADYKLSWDPYTYNGRWEVSVKHVLPNLAVVTFDIDRYPWKKRYQGIDFNATPLALFPLEGSREYTNVTLISKLAATVTIDSAIQRVNAGTTVVATRLTKDTTIEVTVDDWWCYLSGTNLVVNSDYVTFSEDNAQMGDFSLSGTNLYAINEPKQHITMYWWAKDL